MARIWDQPDAVSYLDDAGKRRRHTFDFRVTLHCGRRIAYAVKPKGRVETSGIDRILELIRQQVGSRFADAYVLRTDAHITNIRVDNARLIVFSQADRDEDHVDRIRQIMAPIAGAVRIADVAMRARLEGHALRAIACLIGDGSLRLNEPGLIEPRAFITATRAAA